MTDNKCNAETRNDNLAFLNASFPDYPKWREGIEVWKAGIHVETAKQCIQKTIDSLDIHLQPDQIYAFQAIDKDVFYNYIEAIKTVLKYEAKEWHVVEQLVTHPNHSIYYHVARHDFSAGADHQPIEGLTQCVFAFIQQTESANDLHLILNHPPFALSPTD